MNEQPPQQPTGTQVQLNGGVYPNEDGTWRVCCWFTGIRTQEEANHISNWLGQLLQQNISPAPPPPQANGNGEPPPRPDPSAPFPKA